MFVPEAVWRAGHVRPAFWPRSGLVRPKARAACGVRRDNGGKCCAPQRHTDRKGGQCLPSTACRELKTQARDGGRGRWPGGDGVMWPRPILKRRSSGNAPPSPEGDFARGGSRQIIIWPRRALPGVHCASVHLPGVHWARIAPTRHRQRDVKALRQSHMGQWKMPKPRLRNWHGTKGECCIKPNCQSYLIKKHGGGDLWTTWRIRPGMRRPSFGQDKRAGMTFLYPVRPSNITDFRYDPCC